MFVTFDVSQALMSWSKAAAKANAPYMSVTLDVSQAPMGALKAVAL